MFNREKTLKRESQRSLVENFFLPKFNIFIILYNMKPIYRIAYILIAIALLFPISCVAQEAKGGAVVTKYADPDNVCFIPDSELKKTLTPLQYEVTRESGT
jgi:hypothetical protein